MTTARCKTAAMLVAYSAAELCYMPFHRTKECMKKRLFFIYGRDLPAYFARYFTMLVCIFLVYPSGALATLEGSPSLTVITSNYPPYSYATSSEQGGFVTELVRSALQEKFGAVNIHVYPYARAWHSIQKNSSLLVYPLVLTEQQKKAVTVVYKISDLKICLFYLKKRHDIVADTSDDWQRYSVGVKKGSQIVRHLSREGKRSLQEVTTDLQNLKKLISGRIDLVAIEELAFLHALEEYNSRVLPADKISLDAFSQLRKLPLLSDNVGVYVALSKDTPQSVVDSVRNAFVQQKKQGKIIEVAHWWTNDVEKKMVEVYRKAMQKKGYTWVDYTYEGGAGQNMKAPLLSRSAVKHWPHAMQSYMGPALWSWAEKGELLSLNRVALAQNWPAILPEFITERIVYKNNYVAVPLNIQRVNWLWCNSSVCRNAGVSLPQTWEKFFEIAEKLKKRGVLPLALGGTSWQEAALFENIALGVGGVEFYQKAFVALDIATITGPVMEKVFLYFKRVRDFCGEHTAGRTWTQAARLVAEGKAAMLIMGDWAYNVFSAAKVPYGEKGFVVTPTPGTQGIFLNNTDVFIFPNAFPQYAMTQRIMAQVLMSREVQRAFALAKGTIPARTDISCEGFDDVATQAMQDAQKDLFLPSFTFRQAAPENIHDDVVSLISEFFHSEMTPKEATVRFSQIVLENRTVRIRGH